MGIIVGLDIGGSTTKVVGMDGEKIIGNKIVKADDPVTSAFGALGKFMDSYDLKISDIEQLKITGVGASFPNGNLLGIPTVRISEFFATGQGGLFLSGLDHAIVVSMGTGTAFVEATKKEVRHIIGSGVGGGALVGLANCALNIRDFDMIADMAKEGNLNHVDLTIGTMAVLAARNAGIKDVVITGQATKAQMCNTIYGKFSELYNINFVVPQMSEFATAIGACIAENV